MVSTGFYFCRGSFEEVVVRKPRLLEMPLTSSDSKRAKAATVEHLEGHEWRGEGGHGHAEKCLDKSNSSAACEKADDKDVCGSHFLFVFQARFSVVAAKG